MTTTDVTLDRLDDQLRYYDKAAVRTQRNLKILKTLTFVFAGLVPVTAAFDMPVVVPAVLGFAVLVAEGLLQLNQYEQLWMTYRSTAEALKHEKFLFLALAGDYADAENPRRLLAERVEGLVLQEHSRWVTTREESRKKPTPPQESGN